MEGSCLCGGVAFEVDGSGSPIELCHCSRCRKAYGSAFAATFYVEAGRFRWTRGEDLLSTYDAPVREQPPAYRHVFCRVCGSSLPIVRPEFGVAEIPAGAVEGDPATRPARHIFTRARAPWFEITDDLPRFEGRADAAALSVEPVRAFAGGGEAVILKRFETPDEVREMPRGRFEVVQLGGVTLGRATYQPGWKWSLHVGPTVGADRCRVEHVGLVLSGTATAAFADGTVVELRAGHLFHIPPTPHDSWVVGDKPYVSLHFLGAEHYAK